jgi:hypothetical protein
MISIVGILIVLGAIAGGYVMEHGKFAVLMQPAEIVKPFSRDGYSNWELSTDRANAARKLLVNNGVNPDHIAQVRGFAERQLRHPEDPQAASNRRVSVIVQHLTATQKRGPPGLRVAVGQA